MAALKITTMCMLLLLVGADLARPASSSSPDDDQEAAAGSLLRELTRLVAEQHGGGVGEEVCTPACEKCLIICGLTCVLNANPATCFVNCTVSMGCFSLPLLPLVA